MKTIYILLTIVGISFAQFAGWGSNSYGKLSRDNTWTGTNTFSGAVTFSSTVTFTGNIVSPLTVDYTGVSTNVSLMTLSTTTSNQIDFGLVGGASAIWFDGNTNIRFRYLTSSTAMEFSNRVTGGDLSFVVADEMTFKTNHTVSALTIDVNQDVTIPAGDFIVTSPTVPSTASSTGVAGTIAWDSGFIYICTATNTWKRVAIATW